MVTQTINRRRYSSGQRFKRSGRQQDQAHERLEQPKAHIPRSQSNNLKIIPLGGVEEVGRNMTVLEYKNDIIIIDMGLQFPEEDMPGIDYIIPNIACLRGKERNIRGVIITHPHYDHIGGIPHLIPRLGNPPLYGTDITLAIIKKRQEDFKNGVPQLDLNEIKNDTKLTLGAFKIEFFGVSHNTPGSLGVIARTPVGIVVHTGDFKIDELSKIAGFTELEKLRLISQEKPLILLSDSTNAKETGRQISEADVVTELEQIIKEATGRLIFGTFSSLLGRLNEIIQLAAKYNKRIIIEGRSMKTNIGIARQLGYMHIPKGTVISVEEMKRYEPSQIVVLATGAQGEDNAVLMRIANNEHKHIRIEKGDTFVFSSSVVPGNERTVQHLVDKLYREGAEVINYKMMDIHAGGHAKQEDLQKMIEAVRPRFFMPIEGNHSFLKMHAKIAKKVGYDDEHILIPDNGQIVECDKNKCWLTNEKVPSEYVFVDGLGVGDIGHIVLRDRQAMAEDGMFVIIATVDSKTGRVRSSPDIISRGFIYMRESKELLYQVRQKVKEIVQQSTGGQSPINQNYIKENIRDKIGQFLYNKTQRRPMVLPVVIEV